MMMPRRRIMKLLVFAGLLSLAALCFLVYGNNAIEVSHFRIETAKLPQNYAGLRLVHISDLHGKQFGRQNKRLAQAILRQEPDLIVVSGDMIDSHGDDGSAFINLLHELGNRYPVYCSLGNHEQIVRAMSDTDRYDRFAQQIHETGAVLLDNERIAIEKSGITFGLYGLTTELYHYSRADISNLWGGAELKTQFIVEQLGWPLDNEFAILLAHNPKYFQEYVRWNPDLICAGHIHGGVVRLPLLGGVLSPDITLFPPYSSGLYHSGKTTMHVSRGLGNSVIPFRLFNRPDLSVITLEPTAANR